MATQNKRLLSFLLLILLPLGGWGIDIYSPSLPAISDALQATPALAKLTVSMFLFGFAFGQLLFGVLADRYGRKKVIMPALAIALCISIATAYSPTIYYLLILRLFQGVFFGAASTISKALMTDNYKGAALQRISAMAITVWSMAPILAPYIGGYLQTFIGWQASFYFLSVYVAILLVLVSIGLKETKREYKPIKLVKMCINFKNMLTNPVFISSAISGASGYGTMVAFSVIAPFLIQEQLGYSAHFYGEMALLMGLGLFVGSMINQHFLIKRFDDTQILNVNYTLIFTVSILMLIIDSQTKLNILGVMIPTVIITISIGMMVSHFFAKFLSLFPALAGTASAFSGSIAMLWIAIIGSVSSLAEHSSMETLAMFYIGINLISFVLYRLFFLPQVKAANLCSKQTNLK